MIRAALFVLLTPSLVLAQQTLGPGLIYDVANGHHVVVADLDSDAVEVRVALPHASDADDMITTEAHALQEGATVALNANFFGGGLNHPCGIARGFGQQYYQAYPELGNCDTSLGWARGVASIFDSFGHEGDGSFQSQYSDIVTGGGLLLKNGSKQAWNANKLEVGRNCTAVGVSADRKKMILVATDSTFCSGEGLQNVLLAHGAADAIHLDGGGSTKLWIRGQGYVNDETEERSPSVVIVARPRGDCPSDCGGAPCVQLERPYRAQCVQATCRAGLDATWSCDAPRLRRVRCDGGKVVSEYCAQGCTADAQCAGGAIPEPMPDLGSSVPDGGGASPDAGLDNPDTGAAGCSLGPAGAPPSAILVVLLAIGWLRRRAVGRA